jgi:hypothetical protein
MRLKIVTESRFDLVGERDLDPLDRRRGPRIRPVVQIGSSHWWRVPVGGRAQERSGKQGRSKVLP